MGVNENAAVGVSGGSSTANTSTSAGHAHTVGYGINEADNICGSCSHCSESLSGCGHGAWDPPSSSQVGGQHDHTVSVVPAYVGVLKLVKVV